MAIPSVVISRLVLTLWRVSWQVAILVMFIWLVALVSRRTSSNFRYVLWCVVLIRLCLPVTFAFPVGVEQHVRGFADGLFVRLADRPTTQQTEGATPSIDAATTGNGEPNVAIAGEPRDSRASWLTASLVNISEELALGWLAGMISFATVLLVRMWRLKQFLGKCRPIERPDLKAALTRLCRTAGIKSPPDLRYLDSEAGGGPSMIGWFRQRILLPPRIADEWSAERIEPILLHELAHIKRLDMIVNWLQVATQAVYFFHPMVWLANWRIRQLREEACDDMAILLSGGERSRYSRAVLRVMEETPQEPALGFGWIGFSEVRSSLGRRVARVMNDAYRPCARMTFRSTLTLVALAMIGACLASEKPLVSDHSTSVENRGSALTATKSDTADRRALLEKAESLYKSNGFDEAIELYREVHAEHPDWNYAQHALMMIGICYERMGQLDKAIDALEQAVEEYPELRGFSETTYYYLGEMYVQASEKQKAVWAFGKAIGLVDSGGETGGFAYMGAKRRLEELAGDTWQLQEV